MESNNNSDHDKKMKAIIHDDANQEKEKEEEVSSEQEISKTEMLRVSSQFYELMSANGVDIGDNNDNEEDEGDGVARIERRTNSKQQEVEASEQFVAMMNANGVVEFSEEPKATIRAAKNAASFNNNNNIPRSVGAWNVAVGNSSLRAPPPALSPQSSSIQHSYRMNEDENDDGDLESTYIKSNEMTDPTLSTDSLAPQEQPTAAVPVSDDDLLKEIVSQAVVAEVHKDDVFSPTKHYYLWIIAGLFTLVVAAVVVVVSIFRTEDFVASTASPTISPDHRLEQIQEWLQEIFGTDAAIFQDATTPQAKALELVANDFDQKVDILDRLLQRYVLAILYYSTGGPDHWHESFEFVSHDNECNWSGALQCNDANLVTHIELRDNRLTGSLPFEELSKLHQLESLVLSGNVDLEPAPIPNVIGDMTSLMELNLARSNRNGSIPEALYKLTNLELLLLGENSLSGTISQDIGQLSKLTSLNLELNALSGRIPDSLWDLIHLQHFLLGEQFRTLQGTLSDKIGTWKNLTWLELDRNSLTGTIPTEVGLLSKLTDISISANDFRGTLPTELGNLSLLTRMSLSINAITGTVPKEFAKLKSLHNLYLQNTLLIDDWEWMCDLIHAGEFGPLRPMQADLDEVNCTCCTCCKY